MKSLLTFILLGFTMAGPANSINELTTGISGFSGTAFVGSPATQHCVQIGGATSSTLANVTNGTTGQFLGANTGAAPTWQTPSSFAPNSTLQAYDDFIGHFAQNTPSFQIGWYISGMGGIAVSEAAHPGIIANSSIASGSQNMALRDFGGSLTIGRIILGAGAVTLNWVIKTPLLSNGTNRYTLRLGLGDTVNADEVNGVYFEYSDNINSGNWVGKTASASSRSTANSAVAVGTGWVNLQISVNAAATSVSFYVNGVEIANSPLAATIPTTAITPFLDVKREAGTIATLSVLADLFYMTYELTTPR